MEFTAEERSDLVHALLVWRYFRHRLPSGTITDADYDRISRMLKLAQKLGVSTEYLALVAEWPILNVEVREFEDHQPRKYKTDRGKGWLKGRKRGR